MDFMYTDAGRSGSKRPKSKLDCTVRALAVVTGSTFDVAYERLASRGRKPHQGAKDGWLGKPTDSMLGFTFTWMSFPAVKGVPRVNTLRFLEMFPEGRYIIRQAGHVAAVVDGVLHDLERSDERCVYGAWEVLPSNTSLS